ncbi:MAG: type VII toxin-antitoxin system HepT family RNase toxin [Candidatus Thorarchaeota archaeon]|nr:DUF86 domain-containing protein [Candidatus Thorarchaeota archaeon]
MQDEIIQSKIDIIERDLKFLSEYKHINPEDFVSKFKDTQAVKYTLLEIMEACIDIASHIISSQGLERGDSYADMFQIIARANIIDGGLADRLSAMARFRNLIVHGYSKIDNVRLLKLVQERLGDILEFVEQILSF